jgi:aerobic carbon-monoxide dehydrogenase medium subunit
VKPPPFGYSRPESVAETVATLADLGSDGKVLAGGQSLLPLLSMRLMAPRHLVDINRVSDLSYVTVTRGEVRVGALARHAEVLRDAGANAAQPLLGQALRLVAHATIRNRGTTVGSLVHADPSGEMTAVLALLDGSVRIRSGAGERGVPAADFFLGPLESAVQAGELALEARFPVLPAHAGTAFVEVARRHGDYAVCGVGAYVQLDDDGAVRFARAAYLSVAPTPLVLDLTDAVGADFDMAAAATFSGDSLKPEADIHATADYRRHLAGVLTARGLQSAHAAATVREAVAPPTQVPANQSVDHD